MRRFLYVYFYIFNFLVRRVLAVGIIFTGLLMTVVNFHVLLPGGTIDYNGIPTDDMVLRLAVIVFPLITGLLGIALYRVQPYYPFGVDKHGGR